MSTRWQISTGKLTSSPSSSSAFGNLTSAVAQSMQHPCSWIMVSSFASGCTNTAWTKPVKLQASLNSTAAFLCLRSRDVCLVGSSSFDEDPSRMFFVLPPTSRICPLAPCLQVGDSVMVGTVVVQNLCTVYVLSYSLVLWYLIPYRFASVA